MESRKKRVVNVEVACGEGKVGLIDSGNVLPYNEIVR